jgi:large subunit ribosomal protein L21
MDSLSGRRLRPILACRRLNQIRRVSLSWLEVRMYAVVKTGGTHHRVEVGDVLEVQRIDAEVGEQVELDEVIMLSGESGVSIGQPMVDGAKVVATITGQVRGPKIVVFKYKPKKRYRRKTGHRQDLTRIKIDSIEAS